MFLINVKKCLRHFDEVYVSSDSEWMLEQAVALGAKGILRSEQLCGDTPNIPVYQHAMGFMEGIDGIVAVQANSPTIEANKIALTKKLMESGVDEIMTCNEDYSIYGSIWAITREKLFNYIDAYEPQPSILIKDDSVDIHTEAEFLRALEQ